MTEDPAGASEAGRPEVAFLPSLTALRTLGRFLRLSLLVYEMEAIIPPW